MINRSFQILLCVLVMQASASMASDLFLELSPAKCVTLKQGSQCYQDIEVNWQTDMPGSYCLTLSSQNAPLQCWTEKKKASYKFEFVGRESTLLGLVDQNTGKLLKKSMIEVKWVYKNRSRYLSWRVF
ncbi:MAG: DUF3019 domain-containing protein [Gammaproteobacteria bacterium]|nr:DUF3019 domain-containing protein [Gammaproteobacteria bacterium]